MFATNEQNVYSNEYYQIINELFIF